MTASLEEVVRERAVVICCGSGGVGKTTTSAALALAAAMQGRRACVVTIDPARRLADALDTAALDNSPHRIAGPWPGELSAVMLDAKRTFDGLVEQYASNADQVQRILNNRLYQNLASALSGTQEYMATEKLFELANGGAFDVIVVDTPPTRNALDFLAAPKRLAGFLDNRIFRLLLAPGRAYLKAVSVATQLLLRTLAKVAGSEIVEDTMAFFQAFEGMEEGFRSRAASVERLLADDSTSFVLVASPDSEAIEQAGYFADQLRETGKSVDALIVNRMLPDLANPDELEVGEQSKGDGAWAELVTNLRDLAAMRRREDELVAAIGSRVPDAVVVRVPMLEVDIHDLSSLGELVRHLLPTDVP